MEPQKTNFDIKAFATKARNQGVPDAEIVRFLREKGHLSTPEKPAESKIEQEKAERIEKGLPVSVREDRAEPTFAGSLIRETIKAPLKTLLSVPAGVMGEKGATIKSKYLGDTSDLLKTVGDKAEAIGERVKAGELTMTEGVLQTLLESGLDVADVATFAPGAVLGKAGVAGAKTAARGIKAGAEAVGGAIKTGAETAVDIAKGLKTVGETAGRAIGRVPARVATNVAEKQAIETAVKSLPTKVARQSARDGIEVEDLKYLYNIPKADKAPLKKLATIAQKFAKGETKTNPIEVVGKPITNRIKQLEGQRTKVGKKLSEIADDLGVVTKEEVVTPVFDSLKRVPGLSGLKMNSKGVLDFSNTTLATSMTKSDRKAIQKIFNEATQWGTGKKKHLLRQELFEVLGGKKRALTQLTDTQEKAFESIRKGLSDVLEAKNPLYKETSNQYRKIIQPLQDMRKFMKNVAGADEDILDMSAGLLARRLTSNAASNPQIRQILRSMDKATKIPGKTALNIENLQDFYNVLDKYYNIAGKTSFQGQVTAGIEKARGGVTERIAEAVEGLTGKSEAVRKKAFEKALGEALNSVI